MLFSEGSHEQGVRDPEGVKVRAEGSIAYGAGDNRQCEILSDGGDVVLQSLLGGVLTEKAEVSPAISSAVCL